MLNTLVSSLVVLSGAAGMVSAAAPPPFARANLVSGALGPLSGDVLFTMSGEGVQVDLSISGFPAEGGPWPYHGIFSLMTAVADDSTSICCDGEQLFNSGCTIRTLERNEHRCSLSRGVVAQWLSCRRHGGSIWEFDGFG